MNLDSVTTLKLNKHYIPIGVTTPYKLMVDMYTGVVCGIDLEYEEEDGVINFESLSSMRVVEWDEWASLPVRSFENGIKTKSGQIRIPYVVICSSYDKIPYKRVQFPTKKNVWDRDKNTCLYSGLKLNSSTLSIDHVLPTSRGGQDEWINMATCHRELNSWKSDRLPNECNLLEASFFDSKLEGWRKQRIQKGELFLSLNKKPDKPRGVQSLVFNSSKEEWKAFLF